MRIAMITCDPLLTDSGRGILLLARGLRVRGHRVTIFSPRHPEAPPLDGVVRFRTGGTLPGGRPRPDPFDPIVARSIHAIGFDIIHVHDAVLSGHAGYTLAQKYRKPLVYTYAATAEEALTGRDTESGIRQWEEKYLSPLYYRLFIRRCGLVFASSPADKAELTALDAGRPVVLLPSAEPDRPDAKQAAPLHLADRMADVAERHLHRLLQTEEVLA